MVEVLRDATLPVVVSSANCVNLASRALGSMISIPLKAGSWRSFSARISTASTNKKGLNGNPAVHL